MPSPKRFGSLCLNPDTQDKQDYQDVRENQESKKPFS